MEKRGEKQYILAVDHGTSGVKTSLMTIHGELIATEAQKTPIYFLPNGGAEQDPESWWRALIQTVGKLVARDLVPKNDICAISVSSTMSSTVAVDKNGHHLMNSLTWMDSRGASYVKKLMGSFPNVSGYNIFKIAKWVPITGGGPTLSGKDDIAHVLLTKHEFPEIYAKTHMFLESKDYLNLRLTGEFAGSYDSTVLFWVSDIRDINNIRYNQGLIKDLGIDGNKLPPLRASIEVLGNISSQVASELGLPTSVKVVMGAADHQAALIGSGAVRDFEGHVYIGTSSWLECIVPFKKTDIFHSMASLPAAVPGKYQLINEQDIARGILNFLSDNILFHKNELRPEGPPEKVFPRFDEIVGRVPAGSNRLIFTPWNNGERTPVDDSTVRAGLYNITMTTNQDHLIRAFFEGVAYNTKWMHIYVEKFNKRRMDTINIIGGGGLSNVWCQIFADVLDRNIRQVKNPIHANARGAAFLASVGLGHISFDDIPELCAYEAVYRPDPKNRAIYDELFGEFVKIYNNNKAMYRRLNVAH
ncbi:MAG: FGGY-family carbohydrate kinase [Smithellaceae bacterium]|nr:FGGY-family carbohydrate kinase [Smithellaceae bacterium]